MSEPTQLPHDAYQRLIGLLAQFGGDLPALESAVTRSRTGTVRLLVERITATEVLALFEAGLIEKREARSFLGKRGDGPARRPTNTTRNRR